jgi:hypothetical protein
MDLLEPAVTSPNWFFVSRGATRESRFTEFSNLFARSATVSMMMEHIGWEGEALHQHIEAQRHQEGVKCFCSSPLRQLGQLFHLSSLDIVIFVRSLRHDPASPADSSSIDALSVSDVHLLGGNGAHLASSGSRSGTDDDNACCMSIMTSSNATTHILARSSPR